MDRKHGTPVLRRHKKSGHAYARFDGRQRWFGSYDDPETHQRFARTLAEWVAHGGRFSPRQDDRSLTVADVVAAYLEFAERFYCTPEGTPTREISNIRDAVRPLLALYGTLSSEGLGIRQLKTLREQLIAKGLARHTINDRVSRMLRVFRWATEEELCSPEVLHALTALQPLRRGRSMAKEGRQVRPVSWEAVSATLPHLTRPVAGLVELMWHTGMRPGEACQLRPCDLDTGGPVWLYRPRSHKTQHLGRERVIAIGPQAQRILRAFLEGVPPPDPELPLMSPEQAVAAHRAERRARRQTPLWPSHAIAQVRRRTVAPKKRPGAGYTPNSFLGAIHRACRAAGIPTWSPNQLRHSAASRIRKELGIDAARAVLGHASAQVTEIYAELDRDLAAQVMGRLG